MIIEVFLEIKLYQAPLSGYQLGDILIKLILGLPQS